MNIGDEESVTHRATATAAPSGWWLRWRGREQKAPVVAAKNAASTGAGGAHTTAEKALGSKAKKLGTFSGVFYLRARFDRRLGRLNVSCF